MNEIGWELPFSEEAPRGDKIRRCISYLRILERKLFSWLPSLLRVVRKPVGALGGLLFRLLCGSLLTHRKHPRRVLTGLTAPLIFETEPLALLAILVPGAGCVLACAR